MYAGPEVERGSKIPHGTITPYRCEHNHLFLVFGPHVWLTHRKIIVAKPKDHCHYAPHIGMGYHVHSADGRTYIAAEQQVRVFCACGGATKGPARLNRELLKAAEATYLIGGYDAAFRLLDSATAIFAPHRSGTYDHGLPLTFPPRLLTGYCGADVRPASVEDPARAATALYEAHLVHARRGPHGELRGEAQGPDRAHTVRTRRPRLGQAQVTAT